MRRHPMLVAAGTAVVLVAAGTAYAYYTSSGSGNGSGQTVSGLSPIWVYPDVDPLPTIKPGEVVEAYGTFANPNDVPLAVEEVAATIGLIRDAHNEIITDPDVCSAADFQITPASPATPFPVAASSDGGGIGQWGGPGSSDNVKVVLQDLPDRNQDGCKGVKVYLTYQATTS